MIYGLPNLSKRLAMKAARVASKAEKMEQMESKENIKAKGPMTFSTTKILGRNAVLEENDSGKGSALNNYQAFTVLKPFDTQLNKNLPVPFAAIEAM